MFIERVGSLECQLGPEVVLLKTEKMLHVENRLKREDPVE